MEVIIDPGSDVIRVNILDKHIFPDYNFYSFEVNTYTGLK